MICDIKCSGDYCVCIHCQRKSDGSERECILDKPRPCRRTITYLNDGCGSELEKLIKLIIPTPCKCSGCRDLAFEMNSRGIEWCKANKSMIIRKVWQSYRKLSNAEKISAAARAIKRGIFLNPLNPPASLVDLAIRMAEGRGK